jgi:hypothetical protein
VYPWGGPYDAFDELGNEFGDLVPEDRIQELAKELERESIDWAPTSRKQKEVEQNETAAGSMTLAGEGALSADATVVPPSKPLALPDHAPKTHEVAVVSGLVGDQVRLYQAEVARRAAALEQNQSFLRPGVQDAPILTSSGSPPMVPPTVGDTAGSSLPNPTGLTGAEAKTAAGNLAREVAVGLQGAEAKTAAGELTARVEPKVVPMSGRITSGSSVTVDATIIRAAKAPPEPDAGALPASAEQRPAAYQFGVRDGKIDVLPEPLEPENREFALDIYQELVAKARELHDRLKGTNSARRVCNSVERLLSALGTRFNDLRPGVLLSRERSIAADRAAFGDELFPETIGMMDDTLQTLRDLLAAFPIVRRIEAEVLALHLDRSIDAIPTIREQMDAIKAAAAQSGAVTEEAICALAQNDAVIEDATDPLVRTSLIADKLLVFRNFAGAVIGGIASRGRTALAKAGTELGELGEDIWRAIKEELPKGIGAAARIAPLIGLVTLAGVIAGPVASVASVVPAFKPIADTLKNAIRDSLKDVLASEAKGNPKRKTRGKSR